MTFLVSENRALVSIFFSAVMHLKDADEVINNEALYQQSGLSLHCLFRPIYLNTVPTSVISNNRISRKENLVLL